MKVSSHKSVPAKPVEMEGARGCTVRWLLGESDGTPTFAMREFEVAPGGHTPRHSHDYEHEVFVLEGDAVVVEGDEQHRITTGDVIFVQPNEVHQFEKHQPEAGAVFVFDSQFRDGEGSDGFAGMRDSVMYVDFR